LVPPEIALRFFRPVFGYLAAALLVAGYIYFFERGPVQKKAEIRGKILEFVPDDVQGVQAEFLGTSLSAKTPSVVIRKDGNGIWRIAEPRPLKADENTMRGFLGSVVDFSPEVSIETPENLSEYGLDPPAARFTFILKDGSSRILLLGGKNIVGNSVYVKTADKKDVYLLPSNLAASQLKTKLDDYRDREILKADTVSVKKIKLTRGGSAVILEKTPDNDWMLVSPERAKADGEKVREVLSRINDLRAEQFVEDHPSALNVYGLDSPRVQIEIWTAAGGAGRGLMLGRNKLKSASFFLKTKDSPSVVLAPQAFEKSMELKPDDFKDKKTFQFDPASTQAMSLRQGKTLIGYHKNEKGIWESEGRPGAGEEADRVVQLLSQTLITGFAASAARTGLEHPGLSAELTLAGGTVKTFLFGNVEKNNVYVSSGRGQGACLVPSGAYQAILACFKLSGGSVPAPSSLK
jgi:hypothetical protein